MVLTSDVGLLRLKGGLAQVAAQPALVYEPGGAHLGDYALTPHIHNTQNIQHIMVSYFLFQRGSRQFLALCFSCRPYSAAHTCGSA